MPGQMFAADKNHENIDLVFPVSGNGMEAFTQQLTAILKENQLLNISIKYADHWHDFQQGIRYGHRAIYFAPPHFSAWAINKHDFTPVIRIAESLSFVIATRRIQSEFFELNDLLGHDLCVRKPLNLDYLLSAQVFDNNVISINTLFVPSVSSAMRSAQSKCDGFAVSNHVLQRLVSEGKDDYIRLYQGQNYNNYALIVHPDIDADLSQRLSQLFVKTAAQRALRPILRLYANDVTLIKSRKEDYPSRYIGELENYWVAEQP